uniref:Pentatricopeptide repeat-containing protein n=1 Tax=Tanacetum cinerariifolium TaxID=118510 RepID=A0A6L2JKT2_TANCI|nr:pentatricopeptide repeat-containing protein [Tanacetum cinerariifolium]
MFTNVPFNCLFEINEPIVLRFILDFYSQVKVQIDEHSYILISFMIQHEFITFSLAQFGQILKIPYNGQAVFSNEWDLASFAYSQEFEGPYHTYLPTPNDIRRFLKIERVDLNRTIKSQSVVLTSNQILTKELRQEMRLWEELIHENVFRLGGNRDHLPACLAHMLYCIVAYFFVKRIESARSNPTANLPYGIASISKASKKQKITIIPPKQLFVDLTQDDTETPSPKHQLSSPSAPNVPSKTPSSKDTSSSSIDYIPKSSTSFISPSTNGYLNSLTSPPLRVPPTPPIQESGSMDITLTFSPITPLNV